MPAVLHSPAWDWPAVDSVEVEARTLERGWTAQGGIEPEVRRLGRGWLGRG